MSASVRKKLISLQGRFLWGYENGKRCIVPVKRSMVEVPKEMGGLGLGNLLYKNLALIFKWW